MKQCTLVRTVKYRVFFPDIYVNTSFKRNFDGLYIYIRRNKIIEEINISLPIEDDTPPGRFHRKIS